MKNLLSDTNSAINQIVTAHITTIQTDYDNSVDSITNNINIQLKELISTKSSLEKQIQMLNDRLNHKINEITILKQNKLKEQKQNKNLQHDLATNTLKLKKKDSIYKILKDKYHVLTNKYETLELANKNLQNEILSLQNEVLQATTTEQIQHQHKLIQQLITCCIIDDIDQFETLLSDHNDDNLYQQYISYHDTKVTFLHLCCLYNSQAIAGYLVQQKNINIELEREHDKKTAIIIAVESQHIDIVKLLLDHGADLDKQDIDGNTAIMYAIKLFNINMINLLMSSLAEVINIKNNQSQNALELALDCNLSTQQLNILYLILKKFDDIPINILNQFRI